MNQPEQPTGPNVPLWCLILSGAFVAAQAYIIFGAPACGPDIKPEKPEVMDVGFKPG